MVYFFISSNDFDRNKLLLDKIIERENCCSEKIKENSKELEKLEKEKKEMEENYKALLAFQRCKLEVLKSELKKLCKEKEDVRGIVEHAYITDPILVDDEGTYEMANGLIDLNRDVLMKLFRVVKNVKKSSKVFFFFFFLMFRSLEWQKHSMSGPNSESYIGPLTLWRVCFSSHLSLLFSFFSPFLSFFIQIASPLSIFCKEPHVMFLPRPSLPYVTYSHTEIGSMVSFTGLGHTVAVDYNLSLPMIYLLLAFSSFLS
jgi:hypothetical protein